MMDEKVKEFCISRQLPLAAQQERVCEVLKEGVWTRCAVKYLSKGDHIRFLDAPKWEYIVASEPTPISFNDGLATIQEIYEGRFLWGVLGQVIDKNKLCVKNLI